MNLNTKRIFLAIEVSDEWKAAIHKFIAANKDVNFRWIPEKNWHFTVLFIGDFPVDKLNSIFVFLEKCFTEIPAFEIDFDGFTYFPPDKPRMIWAKGKPNRQFENLESSAHKTLKHFCAKEHMEIQAKPSKKSIPHITLSRLKLLPKPLPKLQESDFLLRPNLVKEIVLYESELKSSGSVYTKLAGFRLFSK